MERSIFLSKALGIYLLIVSLSMLINMPYFFIRVQLLMHDPNAMFITGFMTLILGILMVLSHNVWEWSWRVLVTIIAWLTLLKGMSVVACPTYLIDLTNSVSASKATIYSAAVIDLILALVLCYYGFNCKKTKKSR